MTEEKEVIKEIHHIHHYPIGYQRMLYPYPWHSITPPPFGEPSGYYEPRNYTGNIKTHTR